MDISIRTCSYVDKDMQLNYRSEHSTIIKDTSAYGYQGAKSIFTTVLSLLAVFLASKLSCSFREISIMMNQINNILLLSTQPSGSIVFIVRVGS